MWTVRKKHYCNNCGRKIVGKVIEGASAWFCSQDCHEEYKDVQPKDFSDGGEDYEQAL